MTDPALYLGATRHEVRATHHEGRPAYVVVAARTFPTTPDDLWDAVTAPARIARWLAPVSGDLRLGGRYQIEGNAGGTITACEPPRRLAMTWEFGGAVTWVAARLEPDPAGGTRLELQHTHPADDATWVQFGPGAVGIGWDLMVMGLGQYLAGALAEEDRARVQAWLGAAEGKAFMRGSSESWLAAWLAAGADPGPARAAADKTTAFYLGEAPPA